VRVSASVHNYFHSGFSSLLAVTYRQNSEVDIE